MAEILKDKFKMYTSSPICVTINELEIAGTKERVATGAVTNKNTTIAFNTPELIIDGSKCTSALSCYNLYEQLYEATAIKLKKVIVRNCDFTSPNVSHNLFSLYTFEDNASISFENCKFNSLNPNCNCIRFDNLVHAKNLLINISNCTWSYNESAAASTYAGNKGYLALVIFQMGAEKTSPIFGSEYNWKLVVKDCKYGDTAITPALFENYAALTTNGQIGGWAEGKSLLYVYGGKIYDCTKDSEKNFFPTVQVISGSTKVTYKA